MSRTVKCAKLGQELPAIPYRPFMDALGQRLLDEISHDAWKQWLEHSKMIVNEYGLELNTQRAHDVLKEQCEKYFFGDEAVAPPSGYKPPEQ